MRDKRVPRPLTKFLLASGFFIAAASFPASSQDNVIANKMQFTKICDMRAGVEVTSECLGFVTALIQVHQFDMLDPRMNVQFCTPADATATDVVVKMRPWFRKHSETCNGKCNAMLFALYALRDVYPCK